VAAIFTAFGLAVRSELPLPELPVLPAATTPDVTVRLGEAGAADPGARWIGGVFQAKGQDCLYRVEGVGRFRIRDGHEILVEPDAAADAASLRGCILGGAFGALLHQRRLLPLHASVLRIGGSVVALAGAGGAGKSTLAVTLLRRGHGLLGDDLCAVAHGADGRPITWTGVPRLKLRPDAAARTQDPALDGTPDNAQKHHLILRAEDRQDASRLGAVYILERATAPCDPHLTPLSRAAALRAILANIYRPNLGRAVDGGGAQFRIAASLAACARIRQLRFFADAAQIGQVAAAIEADAARLLREG
jgi:hypothetical protein